MNIKNKSKIVIFFVSLVCLVLFYLYPINSFVFRSLFLLSAIGFCFSLLLVFGRMLFAKITLGTIFLALIIFFSLPGKNLNIEKLRGRYLSNLSSFSGTQYVWGGENKMGIDCSGLLRASYIKALWQEGFYSLNPKLVLKGINLWWNDRTAKMMKKEYHGETKAIFSASSINELDYSKVDPADMAVTQNGLHVLAYLGNQKWIQADPGLRKVVINEVPSENGWLKAPIVIVRWAELSAQD